MIRSIANCSRGWSSIATLFLVVVPRVLARPLGLLFLARPPTTRGGVDAGDCAINVQHAGGNSKEEQHDDAPRPGTQPAVDRPSQSRREANRNDELDANSEAKADTLLKGRAVTDPRLPLNTLPPSPVDPLAEPS